MFLLYSSLSVNWIVDMTETEVSSIKIRTNNHFDFHLQLLIHYSGCQYKVKTNRRDAQVLYKTD